MKANKNKSGSEENEKVNMDERRKVRLTLSNTYYMYQKTSNSH